MKNLIWNHCIETTKKKKKKKIMSNSLSYWRQIKGFLTSLGHSKCKVLKCVAKVMKKCLFMWCHGMLHDVKKNQFRISRLAS